MELDTSFSHIVQYMSMFVSDGVGPRWETSLRAGATGVRVTLKWYMINTVDKWNICLL